ncbi:unnamed protein product [Urochloa humidicola]
MGSPLGLGRQPNPLHRRSRRRSGPPQWASPLSPPLPRLPPSSRLPPWPSSLSWSCTVGAAVVLASVAAAAIVPSSSAVAAAVDSNDAGSRLMFCA